jgi:hypothetical protein
MTMSLSQPVVLPDRPGEPPDGPLPAGMRVPVLCTAETAECTCPDFCERDHDND